MNYLNSILLEGDCASEPKVITAPEGDKCEFKVVYCRKTPDGANETSFFDIEAASRLGEMAARTVRTGKGMRIVGRIKEEKVVDEKGGIQSRVKIVAEHIELKVQGAA
jgi:single-strand DNA-binding protein